MQRFVLHHFPGLRRAVAAVVAVGALRTVAVLLQMALLATIVDGAFLRHESLAALRIPLAQLLAVIVCRALLVWLQEIAAARGVRRGIHALRAEVVAALLARGPAGPEREQTGEIIAAIGEGVDRIEPYVARYLPQVILSIVSPLLVAAAVLRQDWLSALILLGTAPILPLLMILVGVYARERIDRQWLALTRMNAYLLDTVQGLVTLKILGRGEAARANVARVSRAFADRSLGALRYAFLSSLVLEFLTAGAIALVAVSLGARLLAGAIGFAPALFVLLVTPEFYRPLRELGQYRHAAMEAREPAARLATLLEGQNNPPATREYGLTQRTRRHRESPRGQSWRIDHEAPAFRPGRLICSASAAFRPLVTHVFRGAGAAHGLTGDLGGLNPAASRANEPPRPEGRGFNILHRADSDGSTPNKASLHGTVSIAIRDLSFRYPNGIAPALAGIELDLEPGTCTALVGRSGAGKSTLLALLLRFLESESGAILANGTPIAALPVDEWRERIAYVPQRPHLFAGTLHENIRLGRPGASDDEVAQAALLAGAAAFIERLPDGYETPIGERGARLSAGEARRVAIARAFLRDAPVLILDEPAAGLDAASETLVRDAVRLLMHGRTVLVVAHRLHTVRAAQRIVVLDKGRIVETGPHEDLLARDGHYARLVGAGARRVVP